MATLTLIADPFPDWEAAAHASAARDLAQAVAETAPRSCSARYLLARGGEMPDFASPRLATEMLPLRASVLPLVWQNGATARPLDGEFVHALTPMMPLRSRGDDDGSQTSVTIPHSIAWEAPSLLGNSQARLFRAFARRAVKHADIILTPTHATARVLQQQYGSDLPVQVFPLATPSAFAAPADAAERRDAWGLPDRFAVTTARPGEHGRLEWVFDAMRSDERLPPLVVLDGLDPQGASTREKDREAALDIPQDLQGRVHTVRIADLSDVGAVLAAALVLVQPQSFAGTGYTVLAALDAAVPVVHAGHPATEELVLDAGVSGDTAEAFAREYHDLVGQTGALPTLTVLACDRSRGFSWRASAWNLWETHANL
ncbi:mannosyltransferase [Leucobacter manosquensis]|uniref:Mannosyltransferase n=1 Tax=Leucobacter manosquensis TaxID=2810611 RepID=A0ABS5M7H8_9MICO|nr:mannosyltransferase [Leucobacter manosquensis]MBS3183162.1 mannosyltransferase [Leucobacter manosquensis]